MASYISDVLTGIRDALVGDTVFNGWCQDAENLGVLPNIYVGVDHNNVPDESRYPLVCIYSVENIERGVSKAMESYSISFDVGLIDSQIDSAESGRVITFRGLLKILEFRNQVELAIYRADLKRGKVDFQAALVVDNAFPKWVATNVVTIERPLSGRANPGYITP